MFDYSPDYLRRLRNEVPWAELLKKLRWLHKHREARLVFQCPKCKEMLTGVNDRTNLGRCFRCQENWNPIEFAMEAWKLEFRSAVVVVEPLLPK